MSIACKALQMNAMRSDLMLKDPKYVNGLGFSTVLLIEFVYRIGYGGHLPKGFPGPRRPLRRGGPPLGSARLPIRIMLRHNSNSAGCIPKTKASSRTSRRRSLGSGRLPIRVIPFCSIQLRLDVFRRRRRRSGLRGGSFLVLSHHGRYLMAFVDTEDDPIR